MISKVFATSEPHGHETNNHQCTEAPYIRLVVTFARSDLLTLL